MGLNDLYSAAFDGDTRAISELERIAENLRGDWTILHIESDHGNVERVRFIARQFANKNYLVKTDKAGQTALHLAVERGHIAVVEVLIDAARSLVTSSANDEDPPASSSPNHDQVQLETASSLANYDDHQFETAFTAFVRQANQWKNTALHRAVELGYPDIVKLLAGADPSDRHIQNSVGETPLYLAARLGYFHIIMIICRLCKAPSIDGPAGATALHAVVQRLSPARANLWLWPQPRPRPAFYGPGPKHTDRDAFKALINAAKRSAGSSSKDAFQESFGAILDKATPENITVLDLAVRENYLGVAKLILAEHPAYQPGRTISADDSLSRLTDLAAIKGYNSMVKLLCDTYDDVNPAHKGLTALIYAMRRRDKAFVNSLLKANNQLVTALDGEGWTPLHHAAYEEFDSILGVLVETQNKIDFTGKTYEPIDGDTTPLWLAAKRGHASTVILLLQLLPRFRKSRDANGQNILHWAASQDKKKVIQYILGNYLPSDIQELLTQKDNIEGRTPLHELIAAGCYVPELIERAMHSMVKDNYLWTPIDMLYASDDIKADQVHIREALNDSEEANQGWKFWSRSVMEKFNTLESEIVPLSVRVNKDEEFEKAKKSLIEKEGKRMKEKLEQYRLRTTTQIVVTALITTVTFTVGFTMPGGYHQSGESDEGLAVLSKKRAFEVFMVSDALALVLSITSLFIYFISSMYEDPAQVSRLDVASTVLNIFSVFAMMSTFVAGTYVVLSHSPGLAVIVCIICSLFFPFTIYLLFKMIYDRENVKKLKM